MAPALISTAAHVAKQSGVPNTSFRMGHDPTSEASDSDQSAISERSLSPSRLEGQRTKSKKKREAKKIKGLTSELESLLGAAFQSSKPEHLNAGVAPGSIDPASDDLEMQIEAGSAGTRLNKRTRQNLAKMEARRLKREQTEMTTAQRAGLTLEQYRFQNPPAPMHPMRSTSGISRRGASSAVPKSKAPTEHRRLAKVKNDARRARKQEAREKGRFKESEKMDLD